MSKIKAIIVIIIIYTCFIGYFFLYCNDDDGLQGENIFQEINSKKEIKEKKISNEIIIYSFVVIFLLIVINCFYYFYAKKNVRKEIFSGEKYIANFIKIKSSIFNEMLYDDNISGCFLAHLYYDKKNIKFPEQETIPIRKKKIRTFAKIEKQEDIDFFFSEDGDKQDVLLRLLKLLEPEIDGYQLLDHFKNHFLLLDLILIVRLGIGEFENVIHILDIPEFENVFRTFDASKFENVIDMFDTSKSEAEKISKIISNPYFKKFKVFDKIRARFNCSFFLDEVKKSLKNKDKNTDFKKKNEELFQKLEILVGDRENGYQFDQEIYDDFSKNKIYPLYSLAYYNKNIHKNDLFPGCTTIFYFLRAIYSILDFYEYNFHRFNEKQKLLLRIMIKTLIETLSFFNQICKKKFEES